MVLLALLLVASCSLAAAAGNQSLPVEVFMKGENISGFNPAGDKRAYYCFRIPQLLALPSGKLLAFAEGRADGCRPDGHVNRPIVVRGSSDSGKTWGPIGIAGPALPHLGTNYPGAYVRDNSRATLQRLQRHRLRDHEQRRGRYLVSPDRGQPARRQHYVRLRVAEDGG